MTIFALFFTVFVYIPPKTIYNETRTHISEVSSKYPRRYFEIDGGIHVMKKRITISVFALCISFLLAACGGSSPIVGKWKDEATGIGTIEFKDDGTLTLSALGQSETVKYKIDGDKITVTADGVDTTSTFKVEGNELTIITGPDNDEQVYVKE